MKLLSANRMHALFRDANRDLEYLIALEPDSVYNG